MHFMDGWNMGGMGGMWAWWLIALAVVAGLVFFLVRALAQSSARPRKDSAEDVLKRRYAAGDITRDEYQQKLDDLHHGPA